MAIGGVDAGEILVNLGSFSIRKCTCNMAGWPWILLNDPFARLCSTSEPAKPFHGTRCT